MKKKSGDGNRFPELQDLVKALLLTGRFEKHDKKGRLEIWLSVHACFKPYNATLHAGMYVYIEEALTTGTNIVFPFQGNDCVIQIIREA